MENILPQEDEASFEEDLRQVEGIIELAGRTSVTSFGAAVVSFVFKNKLPSGTVEFFVASGVLGVIIALISQRLNKKIGHE